MVKRPSFRVQSDKQNKIIVRKSSEDPNQGYSHLHTKQGFYLLGTEQMLRATSLFCPSHRTFLWKTCFPSTRFQTPCFFLRVISPWFFLYPTTSRSYSEGPAEQVLKALAKFTSRFSLRRKLQTLIRI
jgi:hypothetical protein